MRTHAVSYTLLASLACVELSYAKPIFMLPGFLTPQSFTTTSTQKSSPTTTLARPAETSQSLSFKINAVGTLPPVPTVTPEEEDLADTVASPLEARKSSHSSSSSHKVEEEPSTSTTKKTKTSSSSSDDGDDDGDDDGGSSLGEEFGGFLDDLTGLFPTSLPKARSLQAAAKLHASGGGGGGAKGVEDKNKQHHGESSHEQSNNAGNVKLSADHEHQQQQQQQQTGPGKSARGEKPKSHGKKTPKNHNDDKSNVPSSTSKEHGVPGQAAGEHKQTVDKKKPMQLQQQQHNH